MSYAAPTFSPSSSFDFDFDFDVDDDDDDDARTTMRSRRRRAHRTSSRDDEDGGENEDDDDEDEDGSVGRIRAGGGRNPAPRTTDGRRIDDDGIVNIVVVVDVAVATMARRKYDTSVVDDLLAGKTATIMILLLVLPIALLHLYHLKSGKEVYRDSVCSCTVRR